MSRQPEPLWMTLEAVMQLMGTNTETLSVLENREERRKTRRWLAGKGVEERTFLGPRDFRYPTNRIKLLLSTKSQAA